jgi:hypothetical protein
VTTGPGLEAEQPGQSDPGWRRSSRGRAVRAGGGAAGGGAAAAEAGGGATGGGRGRAAG